MPVHSRVVHGHFYLMAELCVCVREQLTHKANYLGFKEKVCQLLFLDALGIEPRACALSVPGPFIIFYCEIGLTKLSRPILKL